MKRRRTLLWLSSVLGLVAVYAVLGFFLVPVIARQQIQKKGTAQLKRQVSLERVRFNPFTFAGSLEKLRVTREKEGELGSWENLRFNFDPWESLVRQEWRLGEVAIVAPSFHLAIDEEGHLNVADIATGGENNATAESSSPPKVGIDRLRVENGSLQFADRSRGTPFNSTVHPIDFVLEHFSTAKGEGGAYRLSGKTTANESFAWTGNISVAPVASRGEVKFQGVRLPSYMPFVRAFLAGEISDGQLDVSGKYDVRAGKEGKATIADLALRLNKLDLKLPEGATAGTLANLEVDVSELNLITRAVHVARIAADGLALEVARGPDGRINLANLIPASKVEPTASAPAAPNEAKPFALTVDNLTLANSAVNFLDQTLAEPARFHVDQIHLSAAGFGPALDKPVAVELGLRLEGGPSQVTAKGNVHPQPLVAELEVIGDDLQLALVAAYVKPFAEVEIASGAAEFKGQLKVAQENASALALSWRGSAAIKELGLRGKDAEPLVSWNRVGLTDVNVDLQARQLQVQAVQIDQPALQVLMKEDGSLNLTTIMASDRAKAKEAVSGAAAASSPAEKNSAAAATPFAIRIASVSLTDGSVTFRDHSTQPVPEAKISAITGTLANLSSEADAASQIDLTATVLQSPPASIKGKINLLAKDVFAGSDVTLDMKGVRFDALEPYVTKYLGYKIQKGRIQGDFGYKLSGEALNGENHVVLDNFYLGEPVQSPVAMSLPIKLALAVMRNREGKVILNVPVSGTITSPQFSFAEAIRQALQNSLSKVVSAPFAMLGSLFGAPDADLSQVSFSGGAAELSEDAQRNLDTLARALQERPDLQLTLRWVPAPEQDRVFLATQQIRTLVEEKKQQLAASGQGASDHQALLALYQERVPVKSDKATKEPEQALASSSEATVRPPWYVRFYRFVFRSSAVASRTGPSESPSSSQALAAADLDRVQQDLAATIPVEPQAFATLARARAAAAQTYLTQAGVDPARLQLAPEAGAPEGKPAEGPHVYFALEEKPPAS